MSLEVRKKFSFEHKIKGFGFKSHFETESFKILNQEILDAVHVGGLFVVSGVMGVGKTLAIRNITKKLKSDRKVIVCDSSSVEKPRLKIGDLIRTMFMDICPDMPIKEIPTKLENKERILFKEIDKKGKDIVFFIDNAHEIHHGTLQSFKNLYDLARMRCKRAVTIVLVGQPRLHNMLNSAKMEAIGHRAENIRFQVMNIEEKTSYIEWLTKKARGRFSTKQKVFASDKALELFASSLATPLQIENYLNIALESVHDIAGKNITEEIVKKIFERNIDGIEYELARMGYTSKEIAEFTGLRKLEIDKFLKGMLDKRRNEEIEDTLIKSGISI